MQRRHRLFLGSTLTALGLWTSVQAQIDLCPEAGTLTRNTDGSYFYSSDLRYGTDLDEMNVWMKRLNEVLAADGTLLVVLPTPLRGMANGEVVTDAAALEALDIEFDLAAARAYYQDYVASLAPILAVDLLPSALALRGQTPGYQQKLDRHWTPEGARASAEAVATVLRSSPLYTALTPSAPTEFVTTLVGTETGGNRIFELAEEACGDLPDELMETVNLYETRETAEGGLFTEETPLIALAGNSFSTYPYNFDGFLSDVLEQPVLNVSVSGGGLYVALTDLLLKREPGGYPKVILWEYRLTNTDPAVAGPDYYLRLQASDLSLVEFEINLAHADGSAEVAPIARSTRVSNTGEYYLELSHELTAPLTQVSLTVPEGTGGTVQAQLCRVQRD